MGNLRALVVDDHAIFCESLATMLVIQEGMEVKTAFNAEEALKIVNLSCPDIILMDIEMKGLNGIALTRAIKKKWPKSLIIILTMHSDESYIMEAIQAGVDGYVIKDFPFSFLQQTIHAVIKGESLLDPSSASKVLKQMRNLLYKTEPTSTRGNNTILSKKEIEILSLIAEGYTNKEIGERLCISEHTVRNHMVKIFAKLGCNARASAVIQASRKGLI